MGLGLRGLGAALLALTICATLGAGCGSGDETTETTAAGGGAGQGAPAKQTGAEEEARPSGDGARETTAAAPTPAEPLPNEGTRKVAPGVPTTKGGDNSIQEYGTEGPSAVRVQAATVLEEYLDARAARKATRACSYIADQAKRELARLAERAAQYEGKKSEEKVEVPTCADLIGKIVAATPKKDLRREADISVRSMRIEGEHAFLVYEDGEGTPTQIAMIDEGGEWKIAVFAGVGLIPAGASSQADR